MKLKIALIPGLSKIYNTLSKAINSSDTSVSSLRLSVLIVIITCVVSILAVTICFCIGMFKTGLLDKSVLLISGTEAVCYIGALGTIIGIALWGKNAGSPTTNEASIIENKSDNEMK